MNRPYAWRVRHDRGLDQVISGRQRYHLLVGSAIAFGVAAAVLILGLALRQGPLLLWAGVAIVLAVVYLYATASSARAHTRFGSSGFRSRGLWGWAEKYRWDQIANVAVQQVF